MNYSVLIQNRKSFREFTDRQVSSQDLDAIRCFHDSGAHRLVPRLQTKLEIFGTEAREALEGAAGYNQFLVGAPRYLVLLSQKEDPAWLNAGFLMQDLLLKLLDMGMDSCWLTFTDSDAVKKALKLDSPLEVVAIAAFGYGKKTVKRMRLNIFSMSNVDISAKYRYMEPKRSVKELVHTGVWGNHRELDRYIGFFDDMLWESLYAASLAPSYLNLQSYGFLLQDGRISLVSRPDALNTGVDGDLSLGAALLHFTAVAEGWVGRLTWELGGAEGIALPEGHRVVASTVI